MSQNNNSPTINFSADKVYVHHWPLSTPKWSQDTIEKVDLELNKNSEKKKIRINDLKIFVDDYEFSKIKKMGVTIPLFKKETTMVFEGRFENSFAHIHITTKSMDYLEIFNKLMIRKNRFS